jgi:hypothetical protein
VNGVKLRGFSRSDDYWSLSIAKSLESECEKLCEIRRILSEAGADIPAFAHGNEYPLLSGGTSF